MKTHKQSTDLLFHICFKSRTLLQVRWRVQKMHLSFCEFKEPVPFYCILPSILKYGYCIHVTRRIAITDDSMIHHRARGKVWKKIGDTIYFFSFSFFYIFYLLLFLSFLSTVESKTIGYLECPREYSSSDTDSQVSVWPSSRISFRKDFHGPRPTIRLA